MIIINAQEDNGFYLYFIIKKYKKGLKCLTVRKYKCKIGQIKHTIYVGEILL